jgi:hypothetical protein
MTFVFQSHRQLQHQIEVWSAACDRRLLVVEFVADTCLACRRIAPAVEHLRLVYDADVRWQIVNATSTDPLELSACGVKQLPSFSVVGMASNKVIATCDGSNVAELKRMLSDVIEYVGGCTRQGDRTCVFELTFKWTASSSSSSTFQSGVYASCLKAPSVKSGAQAPASHIIVGGAVQQSTLKYTAEELAMIEELGIEQDANDAEYNDVDDEALSWHESLSKATFLDSAMLRSKVTLTADDDVTAALK